MTTSYILKSKPINKEREIMKNLECTEGQAQHPKTHPKENSTWVQFNYPTPWEQN